MRRLLLCLAVTLGLCLGLGASSHAVPPPTRTAPVVAEPALAPAVKGADTGETELGAIHPTELAKKLATTLNVSFYGPDGEVVKGTMSTLGLVQSGVPLGEALARTVPTAGASTQAQIRYSILRVQVEFNRVETLGIGAGAATCAAILGRIPFWPVGLVGAFCAVNSAAAAYFYARGWCSMIRTGFPHATRLQHWAYDGGYCR